MKTYYTKVPFEVEENLTRFVQVCLQDSHKLTVLWREIRSLDRSSHAPPFTIPPGQAVYFIGGRKSLREEVAYYYTTKIASSDGTGLGFAMQTGIKFSTGSRASSFFRALSPSVNDMVREVRKELLSLQHKTITILCVFNTDTNGRPAPRGEYEDRTMGSEIRLPELGRFLREGLEAGVGNKIQARQRAVDGLMDDLLIS